MRDPTLPELNPVAPVAAARRAPGWAGWLFPKPFDVVSSVLYVGTLILFFYDRLRGAYGHPLIGWQAVLITGAIAGLLVVDRVEFWRYGETPPARVAAALLLLRAVLIEIVAQLDDFSFSPFLYLVIPFTAALYFSSRVGYSLAALSWIAFVVKFSLYQPDWYTVPTALHQALLFTVALAFALAMARVIKNERVSRARAEHLLAALEHSHQQLQVYAAQVGELAVAQERNRLAREIHDSLGHYLTVINVQLEKALAFRETRPAEAGQAVGDAKRLAGEALRDVRRSVGALRAAPDEERFVLPDALAQLVDNVRPGPFALELQIEGPAEGFSAQASLALYRAAQEALTNVQKHAGAERVWVTLRFLPEEARLEVRDDGRGFDPAGRTRPLAGGEGGYGLMGVQERLALVGGDLHIESAPGGGTTLRAVVPQIRPPGDTPVPLPVLAGARREQ